LSILFLSETEYAQQNGFGLGVVLGDPTGISAKMWSTDNTALDFGLGYSFTSNNSLFDFYADYVFHNSEWIQAEENFIVYYGPGARLQLHESQSRLGVRGVIGILWLPRNTNFDLFIEAAPILDIIPGTHVSINLGIGFRYFFE
jgi:hypothetical protein